MLSHTLLAREVGNPKGNLHAYSYLDFQTGLCRGRKLGYAQWVFNGKRPRFPKLRWALGDGTPDLPSQHSESLQGQPTPVWVLSLTHNTAPGPAFSFVPLLLARAGSSLNINTQPQHTPRFLSINTHTCNSIEMKVQDGERELELEFELELELDPELELELEPELEEERQQHIVAISERDKALFCS
ncbi:hypothetical protein RJZ57_000680 [Blastomyces gilchristii]